MKTTDPSQTPDTAAIAQAHAFLRAQGWNDAAMAALRVGQPDADTIRALAPDRRTPLASGGFFLGTCDPREPSRWLGAVRVNYGQAKHAFFSPSAGLIAPVDLADAPTVVLADNPLLVGRLYSGGVPHVAGAEDVAVLPPLADWLRARSVIVAAYRQPGLDALRAACRDLGVDARPVLVASELERMGDDVRCILGAPPRVTSTTTAPLSLVTIRDLHAYSRRQVETAPGLAALRAAGLDHADILSAYSIGYLPEGFRDVVPADQCAHFGREWKGNALLIPFLDDQHAIVDLMLMKVDTNHVVRSVWPEPRGLAAPVLTTAFDRLIITDTPRRLRRLCRDGAVPLLLRGVVDAQANAARIAAGGVQSAEIHAHLDGDGIGAALATAGIRVQVVRNPYGQRSHTGPAAVADDDAPLAVAPAAESGPVVAGPAGNMALPAAQPTSTTPAVPAGNDVSPSSPTAPPVLAVPAGNSPPGQVEVATPVAASTAVATPTLPTLVLISHDQQTDQAVWRFGAGTYAVNVPPRVTSTFHVDVTGPSGSVGNSFDLAVEAVRKRQVLLIAPNTGLGQAEIHAALVALLPAVLALVEPAPATRAPDTQPTVPMRADDRDAAMLRLRSANLLERILVDLGVLGADPGDPATSLAWLAAISRLGDRPVWLALTATTASERFPALAAIVAATPPDQVCHITRLTAEALNHHDTAALRHKLLVLGDAGETSERAATSLRLLRDRGVIATTQVERSTKDGGLRTRVVEVHGPIAVIAGATNALPHGLDHHLIPVPVDDSPEARERQVATEDAILADPAASAAAKDRREAVSKRLHNLQKLLDAHPVAIPDIAAIAMPAALTRSRLHRDTLIGLIQASALLHQHQRPNVAGCVVATSADTDLAVRLLHHVATLQAGGLSRSAHRLLTTIWAAKRTSFTMDDLAVVLPGWTRWAYRAALTELIALDFVAAGRGGKGKLRAYTLVASDPASRPVDPTAPLRLPTHGVPAGNEVALG